MAGLKRAGGHTLIVIEHRLDELMAWVDRVVVLAADGSVLTQGDPREVFYQGAELLQEAGVWRPRVTTTVLALQAAGWDVAGRPLTPEEAEAALRDTPGLVERLRVAAAAGGRPAETAWPTPAGIRVPPAASIGPGGRDDHRLFRVEDLDFRYPQAGGPALRGVSLDVDRGEFLAIVGANGAGKSTLAALMAGGLVPPPATVFLEGRDIRSFTSRELASRVGYVFQNPEHQFVTERVRDELAFSLAGRGGRSPHAEREGLVHSWLGRFGLAALAEENPFALSQGQKRRLSVASILIRGQEAVFLDEPTFGQDREQTERLLALLRDLWREGRTLVVLTHDMELVARHAQRLLVLKDGAVLYDGVPRSFFGDEELVRAARLAVPAVGRLAAALGAPLLLTAEDLVAAAGRAPG